MHKFLHRYFRHWLLPHQSNNHRAKILHHSSLFILILLFIGLGLILPPLKNSHKSVLGISYSIPINQLLVATNQDRTAHGLAPLVLNQKLTNAAVANAAYMFKEDYWAHFAPDGTSPWYFINQAGYNYLYAGQNLARGFVDVPSLETAWMNSPEHRANILSPNYKDIGYAVEEGNLTGEDTVLVVEMFGSQVSSVSQNTLSANSSVAQLALAPSVSPIPGTVTPSIMLSPTSTVKVVGGVTQQKVISNLTSSDSKPLIDSASFSKNLAVVVIIVLMLALILDLIFLERKQVVRFVAHNVDHLLFLGMILLLIIFVLGRGVTL